MSDPALHIGIDATTWSNDRGFGRFTREFVTALAARDSGFRYTLIFDQPPASDWPVPYGVDVVTAATGKGLNEAAVGESSRSVWYLWKMGRLVRRLQFDVFYFPAVYSYFPLLSRVPCVTCFHDTTAERIPHLLFPTRTNHRLWQIKTWLAKQQMVRAMTVSETSARDMVSYLNIPRGRIDVVTEAADPIFLPINDKRLAQAAREKHGIPEQAELLVYVGGMNAHKNILGLLKAMPDVVRERPEVHLAIVGSISGKGFWDNVPELMAFVRDNPVLDKHVTFTGYVPDAELVELFASTAALVFPSLWEGFGLPAVEAMSCGVPVLSSDRGSLPEVVGDAGLYYDPADIGEIRDTILRFFNDPELRQALATAALLRASKFSWEQAARLGEDSFRRCYNDVSGNVA
ncbi:glycosyltransferase family 4 protein [Ruegeria meonggei]|uniref:D-inositol 3-phosphate glycosyltransferase n=1 Tax=Ruegeria meonggei TaxID=1446476 RepID=A0A1X7AC82_9RHOB|nr:glycosyltransferase family 1 protein [Ruegeria meonggei]SLN75958.1 D-inositol 3-phosphate glycosyltransferase [Ruegeria meonggei]